MVGVAPQLSEAVTVAISTTGISDMHSTLRPAGQVIKGAIVSLIFITWIHLDIFRHSSVPVYILWISFLLEQSWLVIESLAKLTTTVPVQLSLLVTDPGFGAGVADAQLIVRFTGHVNIGGTVSFTESIWTHLAVLRQVSVAVNILNTVLLFTQVAIPTESFWKTARRLPSQLSVAVTLAGSGEGIALSQVRPNAGGHTIFGGTVSLMIIVCLKVVSLRHWSEAL